MSAPNPPVATPPPQPPSEPPTPSPAQPPPAAQPGQPSPSPEWLTQLADPDLVADPTLSRFKDVKTLASSYRELNKKIGAKGVIPPQKDAKPEEIAAFWQELGAGKSIEDYGKPKDWAPPEGLPIDDNFIGAMAKLAHDNHMPKGMWEKLFQGYIAIQAEEMGKFRSAFEQSKTEGMNALKTAWGNAFDIKMNNAVKAMEHVFGQDMDTIKRMMLADGTPLANSPVFFKAFAELAEQMNEPTIIPGVGPRGTMSPEEARREIRRLEADEGWRKAWLTKEHPEHNDAIRRRQELYEISEGAGPVATNAQSGTPISGGAQARGW